MEQQLTDLGYETFIYIKEHNNTGLRYFGKTTQTDVEKYKGSGKHWKNHIKKHGYNCKTTVVFSSRFQEDLEAFCLTFSKSMDIVKSNKWANLMPENGMDGAPAGALNPNHGRKHTSTTIAKIKANAKRGKDHPYFGKPRKEHPNYGKKASQETRDKISKAKSGENHFLFGVRKEDNARFGKPLTNAAKEKLSKAMTGRHLSKASRDKISKANSGTGSPVYGTPPWLNPRTQKEHYQALWRQLPKAYLHYVSNPSIGARKLSKMLGEPYTTTTRNMVDYCRKFPNGTWFSTKDFRNWEHHFGQEIIKNDKQITKR